MNPDNISANYLEALVAALKKKQMKKHLGLDEEAAQEESLESPTGVDPETLAMLQQVAGMGGEGEVEIQSVKLKPDEEME